MRLMPQHLSNNGIGTHRQPLPEESNPIPKNFPLHSAMRPAGVGERHHDGATPEPATRIPLRA